MIEKVVINGIVERKIVPYEKYGEESYASSESLPELKPYLICPSITFSSLDSLVCSDDDEEECRFVRINNVLKKLVSVIGDPMRNQDAKKVCCLLCKFLRLNGCDGLYVKYLPQIDEIIEFLAVNATKHPEPYEDFLCQLLFLCGKPLLLQRSSEILSSAPRIARHLSLLGYLLALSPTRNYFLMTKLAIERLLGAEDEEAAGRRDAVKPDSRREALNASRLPLTLLELAEVASDETLPDILEILHWIVSVSRNCCFRLLEDGVEKLLMLRMHPQYEYGFNSCPVTEKTDLQLDKEDYYKSLEFSTKILWRLMTTIILTNEKSDCIRVISPPPQRAIWCLQAAFRREVLRAAGSFRSRRLRNELAAVILASLVARRGWDLVGSGLAEDLVVLGLATEGSAECTWARCVPLAGPEALAFKQTLLLALASIVQAYPDDLEVRKNKGIICGLLRLVNPNFEAAKTAWNSEQHWHLFKYASNALSYLVPKIQNEFIEADGTLRLFSTLEQFADMDLDSACFTCLLETICTVTLANCDLILADIRNRESLRRLEFVPVLLKMIGQVLESESLTASRQNVITFLLIACENIMENQKCVVERHNKTVAETAIALLKRSVHPKVEDFQLEQSFLVATGSFIWKCLLSCRKTICRFLKEGGVFLILDHVEKVNLPVQNFYLGILIDMYECESVVFYMFSWKRNEKGKGIMSLLASIWRAEEKLFNVQRTREGCIADVKSPMINDEQWFYVFFTKGVCHATNITTTSIGAVRPKIYYLSKLLKLHTETKPSEYYDKVFENLSVEDQITFIAISSYLVLKEDEVSVEVSVLAESLEMRPLTKSRAPLSETKELGCQGARIQALQWKLLEMKRLEEIEVERAAFRAIKSSKLSPAFDSIEQSAYMARSSFRGCMIAKTTEMKQKCEAALKEIQEGREGPFFRTYNYGANVSTVFNQRLKVQSTSHKETDGESSKNDVPAASSSKPFLSPCDSACSLASYNSDWSFLLKTYRFNPNGNLEMI